MMTPFIVGYGRFGATTAIAPTTPGLEYTMPENRLHYTIDKQRLHYTLDDERLHYTVVDND